MPTQREMLGRLTLGLFKGLIIGVVLAAAIVWGLGLPVWSALVAYATAALAGATTGLVAGRPLWATAAKLEASLKALVGAFVGLVATYGARKWLPAVQLDLSAIGAGQGAFVELPAAFVPILTSFLGVFFELDNTEQPSSPEGPRRRVQAAAGAEADTGEQAPAEEASSPERLRQRS